MDIERRDFVKGLAAASVLLLPSSAGSTRCETANTPRTSDSRIEKSIKAGFGGGFSVRAHTRSDGLTYADIEHFGNRYAVTSEDLLDWKIVGSSLGNPSFAAPFASISSNSMV
jgi:hypothetical protein